jgi:hypothetical protein
MLCHFHVGTENNYPCMLEEIVLYIKRCPDWEFSFETKFGKNPDKHKVKETCEDKIISWLEEKYQIIIQILNCSKRKYKSMLRFVNKLFIQDVE